VDRENQGRLLAALNNIQNLFAQAGPENANVCVVANGTAVNLFQRERPEPYSEDIERLSGLGVHFLLCRNSLSNMDIPESSLLGTCKVVPAGILELVRLQMEGYAYVKP
jgi:intracellular sulfur oxidation DsrE/DsrF family protein